MIIFLFLIAVLSIVLLIIIAKTVFAHSRQIGAVPKTIVDSDMSLIFEHLSKSLQFKTVSTYSNEKDDYIEFVEFFKYLERTYPELHSKLEKIVVNKYSLLYKWTGKDTGRNPVILTAHTDVVPVSPETEKEWKYPAFSGTIADDYIWGRGATDCKGYLIGICEAVEALLHQGFQPERTIYLAFGHDEELGGNNGAAHIARYLTDNGITADYILDEGGAIVRGLFPGLKKSVALIGTSEKGYLSVELSVRTNGGHSSTPPRETAIGILSNAVSRLEKNPFKACFRGSIKEMFSFISTEMKIPYKLIVSNLWLFQGLLKRVLSTAPDTDALMRTTTAVTIFQAGIKENILPDNARAVLNFRMMPGDNSESVLQHVKKVINDSQIQIRQISGNKAESSCVSGTDTIGFKLLQKTIKQVFPEVIASPYQVIGGTDLKHYKAVSKNLYRFGPLDISNKDLKMMHGVNERVSLENFRKHVEFYMQFIINSDLK
jgi:Acetylornithine deacetylase/Succinyl-diaminopimelate desuccinylase and related deacylases